ncbi:MAG TPA: hypothetical protein VLW55_18860 [Burkholderiaceae bacterium]|nr:hypothetical protein [Burkholderiaceae bacterium]
MTPVRHLFPVLAMALVATGATAQTLRADHPLIGTWQFTGPNRCVETYVVHPDGTAQVTSNEEVAESQLTIDDQPTPKGFFKWVEKTVKDNGKKDCSGSVTTAGNVVTSYVLLNQSKDMIAMCEREDRGSCVGPFKRIK